MRIVPLRVVMLATLVGLYELNALLGVAALATGFAYVAWNHAHRQQSENDGGLHLNPYRARPAATGPA
jgi:hypothetical protein